MDTPSKPKPSRGSQPTEWLLVRSTLLVFAALLLLSGPQAAPARASSLYGLLKTYSKPAPAANEQFGNAVAWLPSGDKLAVAAQGDQLGGHTAVGAVYVLDRNTAAVSKTLTRTDPAANDYLGFSVAVSGTQLLAGAPHDNSGSINKAGAAYLYDTISGSLVQTITNPMPADSDYFGSSVAIVSSTTVLIGVPQFGAGHVGRAYLCQIADGTCPTVITSPTGALGGFFGNSVAATGDYFAVAAPLDSTYGSVYVFTTTTGDLYKTIVPTTTVPGANFGSALAFVNGNLLIGAQNDGTSVVNTPGAAYLYKPDGTLLRTFPNPDSTDSGARFGAAVAGDATRVLIGAPGAALNEGRAYLFNETTGALIDTFKKVLPVQGDHFGNSVALLGENFLIGAPDDSSPGATGAGAVYRFGVQTMSFLYLPLVRR